KVLIGTAVVLVIIVLVLVFTRSKSNGAAQPAAPVEVEVARVEQQDVPIYSEWIGTLDGLVNAEIKSQVTGYILAKDYTEGTVVKVGYVLFGSGSATFSRDGRSRKRRPGKGEGPARASHQPTLAVEGAVSQG